MVLGSKVVHSSDDAGVMFVVIPLSLLNFLLLSLYALPGMFASKEDEKLLPLDPA